MYTFRFFSAILAFVAAILISYLSEIELFKVFALLAFILVVDTIAVRFLANLYMREVYKEMEKNQIESMKDGKDDSNS
jgi:cobalamin biosynthesis protein CobD/CbiB